MDPRRRNPLSSKPHYWGALFRPHRWCALWLNASPSGRARAAQIVARLPYVQMAAAITTNAPRKIGNRSPKCEDATVRLIASRSFARQPFQPRWWQHPACCQKNDKKYEVSALCRRNGGLRLGSDRQASDGATSIFFLPMWDVRGPQWKWTGWTYRFDTFGIGPGGACWSWWFKVRRSNQTGAAVAQFS